MKSALIRGLVVALLQLAMVGSLAAKFAYERATCPRVWVKTAYYDPNLPIRGRYVSLQLEVEAPGVFEEKPLVEQKANPYELLPPAASKTQGNSTAQDKPRYVPVWDSKPVRLEAREGKLMAIGDPRSTLSARYMRNADGQVTIALMEPVDLYVPEHAINLPGWQWPRRNTPEWWVEVTLPKKGSPRPLRLGIKQANGQIMPLPQN